METDRTVESPPPSATVETRRETADPPAARGWRARLAALRDESYALWLASRDPRTPWYAKAVAIGVVAYAVSPIDLIPDFIPVIGHLDDLLLLPIGFKLAIRLIPREVLDEKRAQAALRFAPAGPPR